MSDIQASTRQTIQRGFTLVELLVVLGIIGVLMSLLLPSLVSARNSVKRTQCLSNYRTLGAAIAQYATDNENSLVYIHDYWQTVAPSTQQRWTFDALLDSYLGGPSGSKDSIAANSHFKKVFVDPADTTLDQPRNNPGTFVRSYVLTRCAQLYNISFVTLGPNLSLTQATSSTGSCVFWVIRDSSPTGSWLDPAAQPSPPYLPLRFRDADFPKPDRTILLAEKFSTSNNQGDSWSAYAWPAFLAGTSDIHPGGSNFLYADGHGETKMFKETVGSGNITWAYGDWDRLYH